MIILNNLVIRNLIALKSIKNDRKKCMVNYSLIVHLKYNL